MAGGSAAAAFRTSPPARYSHNKKSYHSCELRKERGWQGTLVRLVHVQQVMDKTRRSSLQECCRARTSLHGLRQ